MPNDPYRQYTPLTGDPNTYGMGAEHQFYGNTTPGIGPFTVAPPQPAGGTETAGSQQPGFADYAQSWLQNQLLKKGTNAITDMFGGSSAPIPGVDEAKANVGNGIQDVPFDPSLLAGAGVGIGALGALGGSAIPAGTIEIGALMDSAGPLLGGAAGAGAGAAALGSGLTSFAAPTAASLGLEGVAGVGANALGGGAAAGSSGLGSSLMSAAPWALGALAAYMMWNNNQREKNTIGTLAPGQSTVGVSNDGQTGVLDNGLILGSGDDRSTGAGQFFMAGPDGQQGAWLGRDPSYLLGQEYAKMFEGWTPEQATSYANFLSGQQYGDSGWNTSLNYGALPEDMAYAQPAYSQMTGANTPQHLWSFYNDNKSTLGNMSFADLLASAARLGTTVTGEKWGSHGGLMQKAGGGEVKRPSGLERLGSYAASAWLEPDVVDHDRHMRAMTDPDSWDAMMLAEGAIPGAVPNWVNQLIGLPHMAAEIPAMLADLAVKVGSLGKVDLGASDVLSDFEDFNPLMGFSRDASERAALVDKTAQMGHGVPEPESFSEHMFDEAGTQLPYLLGGLPYVKGLKSALGVASQVPISAGIGSATDFISRPDIRKKIFGVMKSIPGFADGGPVIDDQMEMFSKRAATTRPDFSVHMEPPPAPRPATPKRVKAPGRFGSGALLANLLSAVEPLLNSARMERAYALSKAAPVGTSYLSPEGLAELVSQPAKIAILNPMEMLNYTKPNITNREGTARSTLDAQSRWLDEMRRGANILRDVRRTGGLNRAPALSFGVRDDMGYNDDRLSVVGHEGRGRTIGLSQAKDIDYIPTLFARHSKSGDYNLADLNVHLRDKMGGSSIPNFDQNIGGNHMLAGDYADPGNLQDWRDKMGQFEAIPQYGVRPGYMNAPVAGTPFERIPRDLVYYDRPFFAEGGEV